MYHRIEFKNDYLYFKVKGKGKPIVLLHGFLESSNMWDEFSMDLLNSFKIISIDLPGHGKTICFDEIHTMEFMAECVKTVLEYLRIDECVMVGHSMGGYVALAYAEKYQSDLKALCLFHSNALADPPEAKINRSRAIAVVRKNHKGFISHFIPDLFAHDNIEKYKEKIKELQNDADNLTKEGVIAALEGMKLRTDKLNFIKRTEMPILFIIGKEDPRANLNTMFEQISIPKYSELLLLRDSGHMGYIEEKEMTVKAIMGFAGKYLN
ncbi:MAG: alpha/beta hydrolase [Saprospiraceae bacterium]|nr:alpha/beta hydrolase [Saprospiraceae bacterium]